jgi:hypothetical protein
MVIESRRMRCEGHVMSFEQTTNMDMCIARKPKAKRIFRNPVRRKDNIAVIPTAVFYR